MTAHIDWFNRMLTTAIQLYFQQGCEYSSIEEIVPPDDGWLEEMTGQQDISFNDRVIIMLALMPHTCPQALDIFFVQNKNFDRQYTEFGGWKGLSHGGFLPTGETASFIIAGEDMEKKKTVIRMFQRDYWFYTKNILRLEGAGEGEPFLSGQLRPSEEFLSHVLLDREYKPDYNIGFPAKRITTELEWKDMVLDYNTLEALEEINTWIEHQHTIMKEWGLKRFLKPGYRALFYGPPGTGKTSFGLMSILQEELRDETASVLLLSYTNRAVDEICSKLVRHGLDFIRIGTDASCDAAYKPYLLRNRMEGYARLSDIQNVLREMRILVGTTAAFSSQMALFSLKSFSLAIVDEASQILEPHLLGILSAKHGEQNAIRRFVLIGDHKQLPAVVQQSEKESEVADPLLRAIGLENCRQSLFERLLRLSKGDPSRVFCMEKQGRMHPAVSLFSNLFFYGHRLKPVPMAHQLRELSFPHPGTSTIARIVSQRRLAFFALPYLPHTEPAKVNSAEAKLIASLVKEIWSLYTANGKAFSASQTIGIIVPYRNQIAVIRSEIERFGIEALRGISIDTKGANAM